MLWICPRAAACWLELVRSFSCRRSFGKVGVPQMFYVCLVCGVHNWMIDLSTPTPREDKLCCAFQSSTSRRQAFFVSPVNNQNGSKSVADKMLLYLLLRWSCCSFVCVGINAWRSNFGECAYQNSCQKTDADEFSLFELLFKSNFHSVLTTLALELEELFGAPLVKVNLADIDKLVRVLFQNTEQMHFNFKFIVPII